MRQNFFPLVYVSAVLVFFLSVSYFMFALGAPAGQSRQVIAEINSGAGVQAIARQLETAGVVRSGLVFQMYTALTGSAYQLKPGVYVFDISRGVPAVVQQLSEGPARDIRVAIIEGMTLRDIDDALAKAGVIREGTLAAFDINTVRSQYLFLQAATGLEGYLFPDTYVFSGGEGIGAVVGKFLNTFEKKAWPDLRQKKNADQILILASLVEKEVPLSRDRRLVAGILNKRLAIGMPLQVDATLTYAKCQGRFVSCAVSAVARTDRDYPSPYNTYLHNGLPPGPISNPGIDAIRAALTPQTSSYLYYLSDPKTQRTIFSETLDEHNYNRGIYLK